MCLLHLNSYDAVFDIAREFSLYIRYLLHLSHLDFNSDSLFSVSGLKEERLPFRISPAVDNQHSNSSALECSFQRNSA